MNYFTKESYNKKYKESNVYSKHYKNIIYYPIWKYIIENLNLNDSILDLGCGPSHLGHMFYDNGFKSYTGIDFSSTAIDMAKEKLPDYYNLIEANLEDINYDKYENHIIVATEVFEHIKNDITLIKELPKSRILFSVPNFWSKNHYRIYYNENEIREYYNNIIEFFIIKKFNITNKNNIYVIIGKIL